MRARLSDEEAAKHGIAGGDGDTPPADLAVVLGGDGTMLRALQQFLGTDVPVIGVNFGRVGFLASMEPGEMEPALPRVFAGDYRVVPLSALDVEAGRCGGSRSTTSSSSAPSGGRMVQLGWSLGGEDLGTQPCDGMICATPTGSTAYNLSNGGPVLVWGLDAMAITFVAPHSLHARPFVVPRGQELEIANRTPDVGVSVLVDGHNVAELEPARHRSDSPRRAAAPARDPAGSDLLPPLSRDLRLVAPARCGSRAPPTLPRRPRSRPRHAFGTDPSPTCAFFGDTLTATGWEVGPQ